MPGDCQDVGCLVQNILLVPRTGRDQRPCAGRRIVTDRDGLFLGYCGTVRYCCKATNERGWKGSLPGSCWDSREIAMETRNILSDTAQTPQSGGKDSVRRHWTRPNTKKKPQASTLCSCHCREWKLDGGGETSRRTDGRTNQRTNEKVLV